MKNTRDNLTETAKILQGASQGSQGKSSGSSNLGKAPNGDNIRTQVTKGSKIVKKK